MSNHIQKSDQDMFLKPPRPVLGWFIFVSSVLIRIWTIPLLVIGWIVGTIVLMLTAGFAVAWEAPEFKWSAKIRNGVPKKHKKQQPNPLDYYDEDYWDDYDNEF